MSVFFNAYHDTPTQPGFGVVKSGRTTICFVLFFSPFFGGGRGGEVGN